MAVEEQGWEWAGEQQEARAGRRLRERRALEMERSGWTWGWGGASDELVMGGRGRVTPRELGAWMDEMPLREGTQQSKGGEVGRGGRGC